MQNIECQLAQAQIARFLAGDTLPRDSIEGLQRHIAKCEECRAVAEENRVSLENMLASQYVPSAGDLPELDEEPLDDPQALEPEAEPEPAPAPAPAPKPKKAAKPAPVSEEIESVDDLPEFADPEPVESPEAEAEPEQEEEPTPKPKRAPKEPRAAKEAKPKKEKAPRGPIDRKKLVKPITYAAALVVVLVAMSLVMRDPTRIFGARASESLGKKADEAHKNEEEQPTADEALAAASESADDPLAGLEPVELEKGRQGEIAKFAVEHAAGEIESGHEPAPIGGTVEPTSIHAETEGSHEPADAPHEPEHAPAATHAPQPKPEPKPAAAQPKRKPKPRPRPQRNSDYGSIQVFDEKGNPIDPTRKR